MVRSTDDAVAAAVHRDFGMAYRALYIPLNSIYYGPLLAVSCFDLCVVSRGGSTPEAMEIFNEDELVGCVCMNMAWLALVMLACGGWQCWCSSTPEGRMCSTSILPSKATGLQGYSV